MNAAKGVKNFDYDLLVIGCGPAGQRAAVQAAKIRKRVGIVDKRSVVGGECVNKTTIPSKSFKEAVLFLSGFRQRSIYGAGYRVKSEIEMSDLTFRCNRIMQSEIDIITNQLKRNRIEVIPGHAKFLDEHTLEIDNGVEKTRKTADKILIAVGARPNRPPEFQFNGVNIFDSDDILTMQKLPRELTIVGGGVVGTEYGSIFAALGVDVTIIDLRKQLLGFLDEEIVEGFQYKLRSMGVTLRLGEEVQNCSSRGDGQVITELKSGKIVVSDVVLISAGRVSATADLGLEKIGIQPVERGKLVVNDNFQTAISNIYAAGDVIGFPSLASTSGAQGRKVACHAFGIEESEIQCPLPYGIYSIPEISYVGLNEQEATNQHIPYETGVARFRETARGQLLGDEDGMLKLLFHRDTGKLLGVHIIGESATELVHIGQTVMGLGGGIDYLRDAVFNYPTLAECYKVAAFDGYNKLIAVRAGIS
ncbi:MAG TPA: Si-specific NAD(P)(+) transhydrogenase [Oligoflexia bacterium]|nr:Si-specific NAD(P)(+) transhydrogenase [Oligoflexia bacterium]HMP27525.1 Si-specific NAD(P)(+) transhydrogenase [Oligoflexia bacterium]